MAIFLLKTEPSVYSIADLKRDKKTTWDGIGNNTALMHMRTMKKGDIAIIYHTGDERSAVGLATITSESYPDPKLNDPKALVMDLQYKSTFTRPVTLAQIKSDPRFAGWDLIRLGRLSVVPTTAPQLKTLLSLADSK